MSAEEFYAGLADMIKTDMTVIGNLSQDTISFWRVIGDVPSAVKEAKWLLSTDPNHPDAKYILEKYEHARYHLGIVESMLNLPITGSLDDLTVNYKNTYYTADCLSLHTHSFCWPGAIEAGNEDMVIEIANSHRISPSEMADGLILAARLGQLTIFNLLSSLNPAHKTMMEALIEAATNGHLSIIINISLAEQDIDSATIAYASAAANGHSDIVTYLNRRYHFGQSIQDDAFLNAVNNGQKEVVQALLPFAIRGGYYTLHDNMDNSVITKAIQIAANTNPDLLQVIVKYHPINQRGSDRSLQAGIDIVAKELISNSADPIRRASLEILIPRVKYGILGSLLWTAIQNNDLELADTILRAKPHLAADVFRDVWDSPDTDLEDITRLLIVARNIPDAKNLLLDDVFGIPRSTKHGYARGLMERVLYG